jgi:hypothetical protein
MDVSEFKCETPQFLLVKEKLPPPEFAQRFDGMSRPALLEGLCDGWGALEQWGSVDGISRALERDGGKFEKGSGVGGKVGGVLFDWLRRLLKTFILFIKICEFLKIEF